MLIVSVTVTVLTFTSRGDGYSDILGYTVFAVKSDSMEPEIMTGDLIVGKLTSGDANYENGEIVTFWMLDSDKNKVLNTHRIVECESVNGTMQYTTKGDNKPVNDTSKVTKGDIIAKYTDVRIPVLGTVLNFLQTRTGFFVCVMIPMILFSLYQTFRFIVNLTEYGRQKAADAARAAAEVEKGELSDEEKRRIAEEYLREHPQNKPSDDNSDADGSAEDGSTEITDNMKEAEEHSAKPDADDPETQSSDGND